MFIGPYLEGFSAPLIALIWTLGVLLLGLLILLWLLQHLAYLIGYT